MRLNTKQCSFLFCQNGLSIPFWDATLDGLIVISNLDKNLSIPFWDATVLSGHTSAIKGISFNSFLGCDLKQLKNQQWSCLRLSIPFWDATYSYEAWVVTVTRYLSIPFWDATDDNKEFVLCKLSDLSIPFWDATWGGGERWKLEYRSVLSIPFWDATLPR